MTPGERTTGAQSGDDDLWSLLPSRNLASLTQAVGRRLIDIERIFSLPTDELPGDRQQETSEFFRRNVGPTRFVFDGGLALAFAEWGEQLSVILLPEPFEADVGQHLFRLSTSADPLRDILGLACRDVRIWIYGEDFPADEAMECAVSVTLGETDEVWYCTWLHGDMDADYLLTASEVSVDRAGSCLSVTHGEALESRAQRARRIESAAARFRPKLGRQGSQGALLKEYLRRMALWAEKLERQDEWPFFDVAAVLFPDRFTDADLNLPQYGGAFRDALQAAVNFAEVAGTPQVQGFDLPDPYAPVIWLLERGATLTTEHGMVFAGTAGMSRAHFPKSPSDWSSTPLDQTLLDAIDTDE